MYITGFDKSLVSMQPCYVKLLTALQLKVLRCGENTTSQNLWNNGQICMCYVPGVTRKELGNQIMTNYYSQESQQQALLKFNNLLRNDKIINYKKQWKICTIKESLIYSTLILNPNCPSELTHTNPSTVSDPQISKSYYNFK